MGCGASTNQGSVPAGPSPKDPEKSGSPSATLKPRELVAADPATPTSSGPSATRSSKPTVAAPTPSTPPPPPTTPPPAPSPPAALAPAAASPTQPASAKAPSRPSSGSPPAPAPAAAPKASSRPSSASPASAPAPTPTAAKPPSRPASASAPAASPQPASAKLSRPSSASPALAVASSPQPAPPKASSRPPSGAARAASPPAAASGSSPAAPARQPSSGDAPGPPSSGGKLPPLPPAPPMGLMLPGILPLPTTSESGAAAGGGGGVGGRSVDTAMRPALQVPRLSGAPLSCLAPPRYDASASTSDLPAGTREHIEQLNSGAGGPQGQAASAAAVRQVLCGRGAPIGGLLDANAAAALVRCIKEGPPAAKVDAAWALTNIAASPDYYHTEALCNAAAAEALVEALQAEVDGGAAAAAGSRAGRGGADSASESGRPSSSGSGRVGGGRPGLAEQLLWALGNIAGAVHPEMKAQALAVDVLDAGALKAVFTVLEAEADAAVGAPAAASGAAAAAAGGDSDAAAPLPPPVPGPASPLLRCAAWCLHNLAKHKREKDMVTAIPLATRLVLECSDAEVLACAAWMLAYLGSNEDNKSHLKQALPALPRLVEWVRDASSPLATPSLLCLGTMCTGYMKALDYSGQVVEAGGVPAMLSYLSKSGAAGRRGGVKEALFALSNVAGGSNATVKAMLDAGAFAEVLALLRSAGDDEDVRTECLYVLTNPWDPLVGAEVPTVQGLMATGILNELHALLEPDAPPPRLGLLLKGLADGLKRGQQLMTAAATAQLLEHGREGADALPPPGNPVVELYVALGTVPRIEALNDHPDEEVATRANGILTVLKFFMA